MFLKQAWIWASMLLPAVVLWQTAPRGSEERPLSLDLAGQEYKLTILDAEFSMVAQGQLEFFEEEEAPGRVRATLELDDNEALCGSVGEDVTYAAQSEDVVVFEICESLFRFRMYPYRAGAGHRDVLVGAWSFGSPDGPLGRMYSGVVVAE